MKRIMYFVLVLFLVSCSNTSRDSYEDELYKKYFEVSEEYIDKTYRDEYSSLEEYQELMELSEEIKMTRFSKEH